MPPVLYKSTDASAPTLNGVAGSMTTVLDAILVNGYGSQPAAGWATAFTGTSKRAYRAPASPSNNRFYLRVDDTGAVTDAKTTQVRGYESMSDVDTGSSPFPTVAQLTDGAFFRKSVTADSTARPWYCLADEETFYFWSSPQSSPAAEPLQTLAFGSFASFVTGDNFRTFLIGSPTSTASSTAFDTFLSSPGSQGGHYLARGYSGTGGSIAFGKFANAALHGGSASSGTGAIPYPNPSDGGLYLEPMVIFDNTTAPAGSLRGRLRAVYFIPHPVGSFIDGDTFSGAAGSVYDGKTFTVLKGLYNAGAGTGIIALETSDTWETTT